MKKENFENLFENLRKIALEKKFTEHVALTTTFSELLEKYRS